MVDFKPQRLGFPILLIYFVASLVVGSLAWNATDTLAYLEGARAVYHGQSLAGRSGVVYPPLFYSLISVPVSLLHQLAPSLFSADILSINPFSSAMITSYMIGALLLVALLGTELLAADRQKTWFMYLLCNPLIWFTAAIYKQPESFLGLCLIGTFYAIRSSRYRLAGAFVSVGAAIKIFPIILLFPLLYYHREHAQRIIEGTVPIFAFLAGAAVVNGISSIYWLQSVPMAVHTTTIFGWVSEVTSNPAYTWLASPLFYLSLLVAPLVAVFADFEHREISYLALFVPVSYTYPTWFSYRLIPLIIGATYVALKYRSRSARILRQYAIGLTVLGVLFMLLGGLVSAAASNPWFAGPLASLGGWTPPVGVSSYFDTALLFLTPFHYLFGTFVWWKLTSLDGE